MHYWYAIAYTCSRSNCSARLASAIELADKYITS